MRLATAFACVIFLSWLGILPGHAEKRVALVIGNSAYQSAPPLPNTKNDAADMAAALKAVGFDTIVATNLDKRGMDDAFRRFARLARDADAALFYYAGHGMQFAGANYLLPIDAKLQDDADVPYELAKVDDVIADLSRARNARIVILDSCRDNPLAERLRMSLPASRSASISRGLARIERTHGLITAFATQPGQVAADGFGVRNSPFTTALLKHIATPGLEAGILFRRVAQDVSIATGGRQLPELSVSLLGEFYFIEQPAGLPPPAIAQTLSEAERAWAAAKDTTSQVVLEDFIRRYDVGIYGTLARARLEELKKSTVAVTTPQPPRPASVAPQPAPAPQPGLPALTKADVTRSFAAFTPALEKMRSDYIEKPDETKLLRGAIAAMQKAFPQKTSVAARSPTLPSNDAKSGGLTRVDVNAVYDVALQILNAQRLDGDELRLVAAAINGMTTELDPHSGYLDAKAYRDMQIQTRGEFAGLGIELTMEDGQIKVVSPIDETPAAKAGVMANDIITHLDDEPVQGLTLNQAVEKMRGPEGTKIKLWIARKGNDKPVEIMLTRARIQVRAVRSHLEGDDVGFIRLTQFNEQTTEGLKKAINDISTQSGAKLKGFIIDLRNNPGGLLDQAISVSDAFLEKGEIVSTRGRNAQDTQRFNARPGDLMKGKSVIVLINGGSANASEIVAGALQDHKRATLIGTRSFGKGSVQTIVPLGEGNGALRLTTARYFTPSGRSIQAKGISPEIEVLQDEQTGSQSYVPPDPKDDKALQTALGLIRGILKNAAFPPNPKTAVPN